MAHHRRGARRRRGAVGILHTGLSWTDYTMSFDTLVVSGAAGWVVRASSPGSGYLFMLHQSTGKTGPDTMQEIALGFVEWDFLHR